MVAFLLLTIFCSRFDSDRNGVAEVDDYVGSFQCAVGTVLVGLPSPIELMEQILPEMLSNKQGLCKESEVIFHLIFDEYDKFLSSNSIRCENSVPLS